MTLPDLCIGVPFIVLGYGYLAVMIWLDWRGWGSEAQCLRRYQDALNRKGMR